MLFTARAPNDNRFERHPRSSDMLITVSGPPGSGKSTNAAGLADRLGLDHVSGGDIFREMAAERDMTPVEFNEFAEDPQIDRDLDRRLHGIATTRDDLVLESRLAGWLSADHADFRFWFDAPVSTRAERIAERRRSPSTARKRRPSAARPPRRSGTASTTTSTSATSRSTTPRTTPPDGDRSGSSTSSSRPSTRTTRDRRGEGADRGRELRLLTAEPTIPA